jgi:acetyl-CoA C-acetyltransferase
MSVIVGGARTPIGRLLGSLKDLTAADLGALAIKGALAKTSVSPAEVQYVIMGHVLQAGAGQNSARQAAVKAGLGMNVPALTINKVCLSGINAIALADQMIRAGEVDVVIAGGMESMSKAPHLLVGSREGVKYGDWNLKDSMTLDGLFCAIDQLGMGESTEKYNETYNLTRVAQDEFSAKSHQLAAAAIESGRFTEEITPVTLTQKNGEAVEFKLDEGVRSNTTLDTLSKLKPAFTKDGTITAGSSSQISDGAAALVIMSETKAAELGLPILAHIEAHGMVAGPDASLHAQPAGAIKKAAQKANIEVNQIDLFEINEAFAAVALVSSKELGVTADRVNVNGGAIALGHPIGMSGARIVLHLAMELKRRGGGLGAAALCGGGGQGDALIIRVP